MSEKHEIIDLTLDNIDKEHICCAISDKKCQPGVQAKKEWLKDRMKEGLRFKKYNVNHKVFIEYMPAEFAWVPIVAPNHLVINCFWVAGSYKGKGYGSNLLNECINEARETGKDGVVAIVGDKKKPFLSDTAFLKKKGFKVVDTAPPFFQLVRLSLNDNIKEQPRFMENAKTGKVEDEGVVINYTHQCPFTEHYIKEINRVSKEKGLRIKTHQFMSREEAINSPIPTTTHGVFFDCDFVTHEILNEKRFDTFVKH